MCHRASHGGLRGRRPGWGGCRRRPDRGRLDARQPRAGVRIHAVVHGAPPLSAPAPRTRRKRWRPRWLAGAPLCLVALPPVGAGESPKCAPDARCRRVRNPSVPAPTSAIRLGLKRTTVGGRSPAVPPEPRRGMVLSECGGAALAPASNVADHERDAPVDAYPGPGGGHSNQAAAPMGVLYPAVGSAASDAAYGGLNASAGSRRFTRPWLGVFRLAMHAPTSCPVSTSRRPSISRCSAEASQWPKAERDQDMPNSLT